MSLIFFSFPNRQEKYTNFKRENILKKMHIRENGNLEENFWGNLVMTFQYLKGATRELERDFLQGHVVTRQGVVT